MTFRCEALEQGLRGRKGFLYPLLGILGVFLALWIPRVQVLCVGEPGVLWRASPGEVFTLRYTQSMYGVEVNETFRVGAGDFTLFQVSTSPAALEYLGLEHSGRDNVRRTLKAFAIPTASVGKHKVLFKDRVLALSSLAGQRETVPVKLFTLNFFQYLSHVLGGRS